MLGMQCSAVSLKDKNKRDLKKTLSSFISFTIFLANEMKLDTFQLHLTRILFAFLKMLILKWLSDIYLVH